ncbi:uncharacterized protein LOC124369522 [Homalodisca vitripennis]|uniref:uncharacterized protein LOC124369522 n=1 Tax=Homalodisca vitripennis TaxID=197043 RepID=UPI001EEB681F|nr:uncharacterized protein LOC124369522 [Homalodisca vitripennis]
MNFAQSSMILGCVYIPPNLHHSVYSDVCQTAEEVCGFSNDKLLLVEDFNLPNTDWTKSPRPTGESSRCVLDLANLYDLRQFNKVFNFRGVSLDLVFSSIPDTKVVPVLDSFLPEDRHHPALEITFAVPEPAHASCMRFVPDFRKCNMGAIFNRLQALPLPIIDDLANCEQSFSLFCNQLSLIISQNTPMRRDYTSSFPKWFTNDLKSLVIKKKTSHMRFKATGCPLDLDIFRRLRSQCKALAAECYDNYISRVEDSIPYGIKSFWSHVSSLRGTTGFPITMTLSGKMAQDPVNKCNLFAEHFSSVFCVGDIPVPPFDFARGDFHGLWSKSAGPDGIPPVVLKLCSPVLAAHLAIFFNALLHAGIFPSVLKQGFVVPI